MPFDLTIWQALALLAKLLVYAGSAFAVGAVLFSLLVERGSFPRGLVIASSLVALLATGAQILIQSGRLMDDGMAGVLDQEMWSLVAGTPLGTSAGLRSLGLVVLMIAALRFDSLWPLAAIGAGATALSFPMVGHATGDPSWLLTALLALHVLVLSFWVGGLLPLHRAAGNRSATEAGALAHRFGQQAAWAVGLLVVTGSWTAYTLVGSLGNLISTEYGLTLLAKLAAVTLLLGLAALNKLRLVPALSAGDTEAAGALRNSISFEAAAFAAIFAATAVLTSIMSLPTSMEGT
ncbi:MAG: CopD family protein [Pseudomonadota bacterium]